jgi:hypothetical protein
VVPEILEPSLQLSAAILGSLSLNAEEINEIIGDFRRNHMAELRQLSQLSGGSLGYGLQGDKSSSLSPVPKEGNIDAQGIAVVDSAMGGVIKVNTALPSATS